MDENDRPRVRHGRTPLWWVGRFWCSSQSADAGDNCPRERVEPAQHLCGPMSSGVAVQGAGERTTWFSTRNHDFTNPTEGEIRSRNLSATGHSASIR